MSPFPIPAPAFDGRSRTVGADAVFAWLRLAWNLFMTEPGVWVSSVALLLVAFAVLTAVPLLGPFLACLLAPVPAAGLLALCRKAANGERIGLSDLTAGFTQHTAPLVLLGVVFLLATLIALLFSSLLFIPLWMALWFAPALILFNGMSPLEACKTSLEACLKNIPSFLILGLTVFVLSFLAALPIGLGFLVLIPVLAGMAYASWQDIFVAH
jgi:uncharacterized membrane protein